MYFALRDPLEVTEQIRHQPGLSRGMVDRIAAGANNRALRDVLKTYADFVYYPDYPRHRAHPIQDFPCRSPLLLAAFQAFELGSKILPDAGTSLGEAVQRIDPRSQALSHLLLGVGVFRVFG